MPNKALLQGQGLLPADKTLYVELSSGIYAPLTASVLASASGTPVAVDHYADSLVVLEEPHHMIHQGKSFVCEFLSTNTISLCFNVPVGDMEMHMVISWAAESKATFGFWEGRTWTQGSGTTQAILNRKRSSLTTSVLQENETAATFAATSKMVKTPTLQANGILLHPQQTWSDKRETFEARGVEEFDLKAGPYVVLLTSNDGAKGTHLIINWYEVED